MKKILAEININYQVNRTFESLPKIEKSKDAETYFRSIWSEFIEYKEEFNVLLLNRSNLVIGYSKLFSGGISMCPVDTKMIFQLALKANASGIIVCHNHPSGNTVPSTADIKFSKNLKTAAKILEIEFLDSLIITKDGYTSLMDNGDI